MNTRHITNILSNPRLLGPVVFLGVGVGKTYSDYNSEKPENKNRIIAKDSAILAGSALAFAMVNPFTKMFCNTQFIKTSASLIQKGINKTKTKKWFVSLFPKRAQKYKDVVSSKTQKVTDFLSRQLQNIEEVVKQAVAGTINTFFGIIGAIYSNELMHKYVLNKPMFASKKNNIEKTKEKSIDDSNETFKTKHFMNSKVFDKFDYINTKKTSQAVNRVFSNISDISDIPALKVLNTPMIALTGFSVANTDGYHNKLKKTSYDLLANSLIPTLFVSVVSLFVNKKQNYIKYPALLAALTIGTTVGHSVAHRYKEKIDGTIDDMNLKYIAIK